MANFEDYSFDIKSDFLRIRTKIEEYQEDKSDSHGWQFVKDYVRCTFYFENPTELLKGLRKFIANQETSDYHIIEIKN